MKRFFLYLALCVGLFGADAANDLLLSQRKADNSGNIQRNVTAVTNGFVTFDASKIPTSPSDLTYSTPTLSVPDAFNVNSAGSIALAAGGSAKSINLLPTATGGLGIGVAGSTGQRIKLYGASVVTTPVEATWWTSANPGLFGGFSEGAGSGVGDWVFGHASESVNGTNQIYRKARGTLASPSLIGSGDVAGGFIGSFYDGSVFRNTASIQFAAGTTSSGNVPGIIVFATGETTSRVDTLKLQANGLFVAGLTARTTAAWGTTGIIFRGNNLTVTDSTSSGTVASAVASVFSTPTFAALSATTFTNAANLYIAGDVANGTNVTLTNSYGLWNAGKTRLDGAVNMQNKVTTYNGLATQGNGLVSVQGTGRTVGATGATAALATYTVSSSDASFVVSAQILVTASTTHNFTTTVTYTDTGNTSRTVTLNFSNLSGTIATAIANAGGAIPYAGVPIHIRAKAATTITVATTGVFTSVTYNAEAVITKLQ